MKLSDGQRLLVADKLMDSANLALGGLVFGQLLSERIQPVLLVLGGIIYVFGWITALTIRFYQYQNGRY